MSCFKKKYQFLLFNLNSYKIIFPWFLLNELISKFSDNLITYYFIFVKNIGFILIMLILYFSSETHSKVPKLRMYETYTTFFVSDRILPNLFNKEMDIIAISLIISIIITVEQLIKSIKLPSVQYYNVLRNALYSFKWCLLKGRHSLTFQDIKSKCISVL